MASKSPIIIVVLACAWVMSLAVYGYMSDGYLAQIAGYDRNLQSAAQEIKEKSQRITDLTQHNNHLESRLIELANQLRQAEIRLQLEKSRHITDVANQLSSDLTTLQRQYCEVMLRMDESNGLPSSFIQSIKSISNEASITTGNVSIISLSECKHTAEYGNGPAH